MTGHPLDDYAATLKRMRVQSWAEFARAVRAGASAGRVAGTVVARTERRTRNGSKMGIIGLSDPTGHYEAVLFSEGLAQFRDLLEPGAAVLLDALRRGAGRRRARAHSDRSSRSIRRPPSCPRGCASFCAARRRSKASPNGSKGPSTGARCTTRPRKEPEQGDGEVALILLLGEGTEVEVKLPGRFKVSPQIAGAIKAVPGVVAVEAV